MKTPPSPRIAKARRQRGIAALELALLLPLLVMLLAAPIVLARALLHVNVAQRAIGNAVRSVAMVPLYQRTTADFSGGARTMLASSLVHAGVVNSGSTDAYVRQLDVSCFVPVSVNCKAAVTPEQIRFDIEMSLPDPFTNLPVLNTMYPPVAMTVYERYAYSSGQPK